MRAIKAEPVAVLRTANTTATITVTAPQTGGGSGGGGGGGGNSAPVGSPRNYNPKAALADWNDFRLGGETGQSSLYRVSQLYQETGPGFGPLSKNIARSTIETHMAASAKIRASAITEHIAAIAHL